MTLPDWLEPLPDAQEQRALDTWAIEERGIPGGELMERAGAGLARVCAETAPEGRIVVVVGKGNNGGDGLVAARVLREPPYARTVDVRLLVPADELQGDAAANLRRLPGDAPQPFDADALNGAALVLDAILGTGFSGEPRDPARAAIRAMNDAGARVVACDVPSGVDASSGEIAGEAVRADATATFHASKPGLWVTPGKEHAGATTVVDIGIPSPIAGESGPDAEPTVGLITPKVLGAIPRRSAGSTKFSAGSVLVCGGSHGLTGAPAMASLSAARAGAGYVTVAAPASLAPILSTKLLEVMSVELPEEDGVLAPRAVETVLERIERVQCLVLGPGLGRDEASQTFAREVAARAEVPLVLDADGLNAHAGHLDTLARRSAPTVLTPHAGELSRLIEADGKQIAAERLGHAREAAARTNAIVVLKGDDTIVAEPEGRLAVSPGGAPALATAGTGDVLSGVIAAHLAKGMEAFDAACAGVFVHLSAGRLAAERIGPEGVMAGDVIGLLPAVLAAPAP